MSRSTIDISPPSADKNHGFGNVVPSRVLPEPCGPQIRVLMNFG